MLVTPSDRFRLAREHLQRAAVPEDVFGDTVADVATTYRQLAKITHPDHWPGGPCHVQRQMQATAAFHLLQDWYRKAQDKIKLGTYGDRSACAKVTITNRKATYVADLRVGVGALADLYAATTGTDKRVLVKVGRAPGNNDLLANEATILRYLREEGAGKALRVMEHIPTLVDSFQLQTKDHVRKQVNVFEWTPGGVTLAEVMRAYPGGIDPRDMAWMFNRTLAALLAAHQSGVIHGAVTPDHVVVYPATHGGMLVDWCYAVHPGEPIKAWNPEWASFYAVELLDKTEARFGSDICMAAKCAIALVGKLTMPRKLEGFLRSCTLGQAFRAQDVYAVFEEFQQVLAFLYGPRKFREFKMPPKGV